jgi:hypothetical protein
VPERKPFLLRVPEELLDELRAWAEQEMRSLNAQIEWVLRDAIRRRRGGEPRGGDEGGGAVRRRTS